MKDRFSVSIEHAVVVWLNKLVDDSIFSSRSHAFEFFSKTFRSMNMEDLILLNWGKGEKAPLFLDTQFLQELDKLRAEAGHETIVAYLKGLTKKE